jgi:hypothetical protein
VGKHLLDETAEFRMPRIARHAAEDDAELDSTQRFDSGFRHEKPAPPAPWETDAR